MKCHLWPCDDIGVKVDIFHHCDTFFSSLESNFVDGAIYNNNDFILYSTLIYIV